MRIPPLITVNTLLEHLPLEQGFAIVSKAQFDVVVAVSIFA